LRDGTKLQPVSAFFCVRAQGIDLGKEIDLSRARLLRSSAETLTGQDKRLE